MNRRTEARPLTRALRSCFRPRHGVGPQSVDGTGRIRRACVQDNSSPNKISICPKRERERERERKKESERARERESERARERESEKARERVNE